MDEMRVNLKRGKDAWPGCPACGRGVASFSRGSIAEYAVWVFDCGCELSCRDVNDPGDVMVDFQCPGATHAAVKRCVFVVDEPEPAGG